MEDTPQRLRYPEAEHRISGLSALLDAYHVTDQGVHEAIRREHAQGRQLACAKGCSSCCHTHADIPVYPLELVGIYWFATEQLDGAEHAALQQRLAAHPADDGCPFLLEGACAIHPLRPMACRNFNVFTRPCAPGEDAFHSRRGDVLTPIRRYQEEAFFLLLPFHGVKAKAERRRAIKHGSVHAMARVLKALEWSRLAERMAQAAVGKAPA